MGRHVALYIRVSTDEQAIEGNSLTEQEEKLREYATANGMIDIVVYKDDGYSAKNMDRPALKRLLRDIESNLVEGVITTRIDRLTRKNNDFSTLIELMDNHKCWYRSIRQNFEIGTAAGKMTAQVFSVFAEFERNMIAERVYENLYSMAKRGQMPSKPPFGYTLQDGKLVPHPEESVWLRKAAELLLSGAGSRTVATFLNNNGVKSKTGRLWSDGAVRTLFHNEALIGKLTWNKRKGIGKNRTLRDPSEWIVIEDAHEPLLTQEEFDKINELFARRAGMPARSRNGSRLLSGIAKCGHCGGSLVAGWTLYDTQAGRVRKKTYRCGNYVQNGSCKQGRSIPAEELDEAVVSMLLNVKKDAVDIPVDRIVSQSSVTDKIDDCKHRIKVLDERIQRLFEALSLGVISAQDFKQQRDMIESQKEDEVRRLESLQSATSGPEYEQQLKEQFKERMSEITISTSSDEATKRKAILDVIAELVVTVNKDRSMVVDCKFNA